jgi:hypothetical protein
MGAANDLPDVQADTYHRGSARPHKTAPLWSASSLPMMPGAITMASRERVTRNHSNPARSLTRLQFSDDGHLAKPREVAQRRDRCDGQLRRTQGGGLGRPRRSPTGSLALTRGTDANLAYVFTLSPKRADTVPGPRPAPELTRYDRLHSERTGDPGPATLQPHPARRPACSPNCWTTTASSSRPPRPAARRDGRGGRPRLPLPRLR